MNNNNNNCTYNNAVKKAFSKKKIIRQIIKIKPKTYVSMTNVD